MPDTVAPGSGFRSRQVDVSGHRLHVREAGSGEPVVLVHGLGVSGRYLEPLGELLAARRRILVPDLPGWGRSEDPPRALDVEAAAEVLADSLRLEAHDADSRSSRTRSAASSCSRWPNAIPISPGRSS